MTESTPPPTSPDPSRTTGTAADRGQPVESLSRYLELNFGRFTEEALARAARDAGYSDVQIDQAMAQVRARATVSPVGTRATRAVLAAYLVTFGLLTGGMFASEYARRYGGHIVGAVILAVLLGLALLISLLWVRSRARLGSDPATGMAALLSVPIVLLVIVAGLCIGTGYPIPRAY